MKLDRENWGSNCLVARLVTNNDKHRTMSGVDAIFNQASDAFIYLLPHFVASRLQERLEG